MNREFYYWLTVTEKFPEHRCRIPFTFKVRGVSMYPLIRSGIDDVTMVRWLKDSELRPGSIVFFECNQVALGYVLHRIIKETGTKFLRWEMGIFAVTGGQM